MDISKLRPSTNFEDRTTAEDRRAQAERMARRDKLRENLENPKLSAETKEMTRKTLDGFSEYRTNDRLAHDFRESAGKDTSKITAEAAKPGKYVGPANERMGSGAYNITSGLDYQSGVHSQDANYGPNEEDRNPLPKDEPDKPDGTPGMRYRNKDPGDYVESGSNVNRKAKSSQPKRSPSAVALRAVTNESRGAAPARSR